MAIVESNLLAVGSGPLQYTHACTVLNKNSGYTGDEYYWGIVTICEHYVKSSDWTFIGQRNTADISELL